MRNMDVPFDGNSMADGSHTEIKGVMIMGISINVSMKQDYSYLFQSLSSSSSSSGLGNLSFLSDYAAIKNGSYGKLMKAYYAEMGSASKSSSKTSTDDKSISTASDSAKTLANIEKAAEEMKESADELLTIGNDSVFKKISVTTKDEQGFDNTTKEYDVDKIYKSVSAFVEDYNNLLDVAGDANTQSVLNKTLSLINMTEANETLLSKVGITIGEDNTLSIDEEAFKAADMNTVKSLFNGNSSYAYRVSAQSSLIDYAATRESSKANTYTGTGTYSNSYSTGNLIDALF